MRANQLKYKGNSGVQFAYYLITMDTHMLNGQ